MAHDFSEMQSAIVATFAPTFTLFYKATGESATINAIQQAGDRFTQQYPGAIAGLFLLVDGREPAVADEIQVPTGRDLRPGFYRVAEIIRNGNNGRLLLLQYIRK